MLKAMRQEKTRTAKEPAGARTKRQHAVIKEAAC
jgi:hypothetical protein